MAELKICRVCLVQNVKMYKYLKEYEEIINKTITDNDVVPQWFCFECTQMLLKFYNFKQKCYRGLHLLKKLLEEGPLSSDAVNRIDRKISGLESSIQVTSNSNLKIKTYIFKYTKPSVISDCSNFKINREEIRQKHKFTYGCKKGIDTVQKKPDENDSIINFNDEIIHDDYDGDIKDIDIQDNRIMSTCGDLKNANHISNRESMKSTQKGKIAEIDKFKRSMKKKILNPNHWKRFSLTDEEAAKEFKAKEANQKYLKANFKCSHCFRAFSQEEMLKRHMKIKHCKSLGSFECRFCHMRVKWKSRLQKHLKEHFTRYKCLRCELSFSVEETAFKHDEFHNGVTRTCPHCGEQFRHSSSFYTHLRKHRSKYVCTHCGISFLSEFGLYMHKKVKHILTNTGISEPEENMFCDVCDIKFETRTAYEEHLFQSAMHTQVTGEEDCASQPLKWRYTQRRAPRKYTNCKTCGQNFSTYVAYSKHHLMEHPDVPLVSHPYKQYVRKICEICGLTVAPVSLAAHINTHTREKCHTCNMCGTQLSSKSGLNRHRLIHTGEKPNKCNLCDKSFAQTTNMKLHYRTVHLKEPSRK